MDVLIQIILLFELCFGITWSEKLLCWHCISQVPLDHLDIEEINAFKVYMFSRYIIPPSSKFCHDSKLYDFPTVPTQECEFGDSCVMTRIRTKDITLVIRGCLDKLFQNGYSINKTTTTCDSSENSSCFCEQRLCNISSNQVLSFIILFLPFYFIYNF